MTDRLHWKTFFALQRSIQFRRWRWRAQHNAHDHDFVELVIITDGSGFHDSAAGVQTLSPGCVILLIPGVWHEYRDCSRLGGWDCCFSKDLLYRELSWITDDPVLGCLLLRSLSTPFHHKPVIGSLSPERLALTNSILEDALLHQQGADCGPRTFGVMLLLLGFFAEAVVDQLPAWNAPAANPTLRSLVQRTKALLAEDLTREWTLTSLAKAMDTTPGLLSRAFRAQDRRGPMTYYVHSRMEHAAMLLLRSELSISAVGAQVGVFDANYFSRRFRVAMGMRPTDYRRRFQAPAEG